MAANELKRDQEELVRLLQLSSRINVRSFLQGRIDELQPLIQAQQQKDATELAEQQKSDDKPSEEKTAPVTPKLPLKKITSYAWDQSDAFVKIYATDLPGASKLTPENVDCQFNPIGFNLTVKNLNGKNHQLQIVSLYGAIVPEDSKIKIKTDSVLVMLKKAKKEKWEGITEIDRKKKQKQKETAKPDASEDPQAGIMNLMQKMYDDGDDDMKRTIAKAWSESQEKKAAGDFTP